MASYIPLCFCLEEKKILIIGSGPIAIRKLEQLLNYTSNISIISKEYPKGLKELVLEYDLVFTCKNYESSDLMGYDIVIACIDDLKLQEDIYKDTRKNSQLYSCVDFPKYCDFIFPSIIQKGDLQISFTTGGVSPSFSKELRIFFENIIPNEVISFLDEMKRIRNNNPKGVKRQNILKEKSKLFFQKYFYM